MTFTIKNLLDRISISNMLDMHMYDIDTLVATMLAFNALEKDLTLYTDDKDGFLNIDIDNFAKLIHPNFKTILISKITGTIYYADDVMLAVSSGFDEEEKFSAKLLTSNKEYIEKFDKACKEHIKVSQLNTVFSLVASPDGFYISPLGKINSPTIKENYSKDVIDGYEFVLEDFKSENPHGRLVIINGPPGTGKTYLIKGMISELKDSTVIVVPPKMIAEIDGPNLIPVLINHHRKKKTAIVLVIEDADACLAPRASDNISSISSLLNYVDGILGSILNIRVIATTNQSKMEFDSALVRPGRLSKHIEVGVLEAETATQIYRRLTDDQSFKYSENNKTLAEVYDDAFKKSKSLKKQEPKASKKIGFGG